MSRHAGSAKCKNEARKAMIARLGLVEVWWREGDILSAGCIPVVVIWEELAGTKKSKRRRYSEPGPVEVVRTLSSVGLDPKRISSLLRGPKDELERELAVVALAGKREHQNVPFGGAVPNWNVGNVRTTP
jgi:hypothetical protein